jgi:hypothetical protein
MRKGFSPTAIAAVCGVRQGIASALSNYHQKTINPASMETNA